MATSNPTTLKTSTRRSTRSAASRVTSARATARPIDISPQERRRMIEEAAYYRAQQRGFTPGNELEDWIAAETEVDERLVRLASC